MKLYITGSVGSGKSTLAEEISKITNIPCLHLDNVMHTPCSSGVFGNIKRSDEEIENIFCSVISQDNYIIEDNGRECFINGMKNSDKIIVLDIPIVTRKYRIIMRWIKQRLGFEKCNYEPNFKMLKSMFCWLKNYESGKDGTKSRIKQFEYKVIYLTSQNEIERFLLNIDRDNL